jgi:dihydropteroate synthase
MPVISSHSSPSSPWPCALPLAGRVRTPLLMGIVNATPDSFSDGGAYDGLDHSLTLLEQGADILDIGGESTRPGADEVEAAQEQARILPIISSLREIMPQALVSVDTYKASTARMALAAGARIVNDVWGLQRDPAMADVVAEAGAGLVIMHNRPQKDETIDIVADMERFFERSLTLAQRAGIAPSRIVLDPGIGFGKTMPQNLSAIAALPRLKQLGHGLLLGVSRKSILGHVTGRPVRERLPASLAVNVYGALHGADILRVHDVDAHKDAVLMLTALSHTNESSALCLPPTP